MTMGLVRLIAATTVLLSALRHSTARDVEYCYADDDDPYLLFSSATAYHFVHGGKNRYQTIPNCRPAQIWMLARHGTRYPNRQESRAIQELTRLRDEIINNHESRRNGRMCNVDLENLRKWRPDYLMNGANYGNLAPQGYEDLKLMARRLQSNFPELLEPENEEISPVNYKFSSANSQRSRESLFAFMEGLLGSRYATLPDPSLGNDTLCRASETDAAGGSEADDASVLSEVIKFERGDKYASVLRSVSQRLGYLYDLRGESLLKMYDACRFEKALNVSALSAWCAAFSRDELMTIEYREDLLQDSRNRRERQINRNARCNPLGEMFSHFRNLEKDGQRGLEPKGIFYFVESELLYHLYRTLGLNEDPVALRADNFDSMAKTRHWRTSLIDPFASNFVAVFYKCDESYAPNKVTFYLEEKLVHYPGCNVGLCDWEFLKNKLSQVAYNGVAPAAMQNTLLAIAMTSLPAFFWNLI